jgi:hypothetical protein
LFNSEEIYLTQCFTFPAVADCIPGENGCKAYYLSKDLVGHWHEANQFCRIFGMELLKVESADEESKLFAKLIDFRSSMSLVNHIDGMSPVVKSKVDWYTTQPMTKINHTMLFQGALPNNGISAAGEYCLSINAGNNNMGIGYDDMPCQGQYERVKFFCQKGLSTDTETLNAITANRLDSQRADLESLKTEVQQCQKKQVPDPIVSINSTLSNQNAEIENLKAQVAECQKKQIPDPFIAVNRTLNSQNTEIASLKAQVAECQIKQTPDPLVAVSEQLSSQKAAIQSLNSKITALENSNSSGSAAATAAINEKLNNQMAAIESLNAKFAEMQNSNSFEATQALNDKLNSQTTEIEKLKVEIEALKKSQNGSVDPVDVPEETHKRSKHRRSKHRRSSSNESCD